MLFFVALFNFVCLVLLITVFGSSGYKKFIFEEVCENGGNYNGNALDGSKYPWEGT